ncbi:MAG: magnesium transporter CorA family protein [Rhodospirillales bacterium]|nr:magnesium transporter CorA family protein [Rhodospirillales bacterium]
MIHAYVPRNGVAERLAVASGAPLPTPALWFDLIEPTPEERACIDAALGTQLPTREEMREIEPSSRIYTEGEASYMTATIIAQADAPNPVHDSITFVLARHSLVTLRYTDPRPIATYAARILRQPGVCASGEEALIGLLEAFVDRIADILEKIGVDLDAVSRQIFDRQATAGKIEGAGGDLQVVLKALGRNDDLASSSRESLLSLSRVVRFLVSQSEGAPKKESKERKLRLETLSRDIISLNEHVAFESHKVNFLLDATLGMINIEQNRIIKLFTVAAVMLMPPTLVASIYGMNFRHMPELEWMIGYPLAVGLMICSALVPYLYFRRKGWF